MRAVQILVELVSSVAWLMMAFDAWSSKNGLLGGKRDAQFQHQTSPGAFASVGMTMDAILQ